MSPKRILIKSYHDSLPLAKDILPVINLSNLSIAFPESIVNTIIADIDSSGLMFDLYRKFTFGSIGEKIPLVSEILNFILQYIPPKDILQNLEGLLGFHFTDKLSIYSKESLARILLYILLYEPHVLMYDIKNAPLQDILMEARRHIELMDMLMLAYRKNCVTFDIAVFDISRNFFVGNIYFFEVKSSMKNISIIINEFRIGRDLYGTRKFYCVRKIFGDRAQTIILYVPSVVDLSIRHRISLRDVTIMVDPDIIE